VIKRHQKLIIINWQDNDNRTKRIKLLIFRCVGTGLGQVESIEKRVVAIDRFATVVLSGLVDSKHKTRIYSTSKLDFTLKELLLDNTPDPTIATREVRL
jgi:hypothetical protein